MSDEDLEAVSKEVSQPLEASFPQYGIALLESHHAQDFRMDWTRHPFVKILSIINGNGYLRTREHEIEIEPGDFLLVPEQEAHRLVDRPKMPLSLHIVCIRADVLKEARQYDPNAYSSSLRIRQSLSAQRLRELVRQLFAECEQARLGYANLIKSKTLEALVLFQRYGRDLATQSSDAGRTTDERMRDYVEQLGNEFYLNESLAKAASRLGMSQRNFTLRFREIAGRSRQQYIGKLRIEHACRLLRDPRRSIVGIAFECGYNDLTTFYRSFRKETSSSPCQYRKEKE